MKYPLTRYKFSDKYYVLVYNNLNKAEILRVTNPKLVNDFFLSMGMKPIKTFTAKTPRIAYNKARKRVLKILEKERKN